MNKNMKTEELKFIGNDPGAVMFGNFINYYTFHNTKERISNLSPQMFPNLKNNDDIICLDIGCNTGELTVEIHNYLKDIYPNLRIHFLAVDIDPKLIQRAQEAYKNTNINFIVANVVEKDCCDSIKNYLASFSRTKFDVTFCFSTTMWIHLNNGDKGLLNFLKFLKNISACIIIEPQPWNCYRNAQRRIKKSGSSFPLYEKLEIRSDVHIQIEQILLNESCKKIYESPNSSWNRKILSFHIL